MMRSFLATATMLAGLLLVGGCTGQGGTTTMMYESGQKLPPLSTVQTPTRYGLYAADSPNPIWSEELNRGDEYGFVVRADGNVYGVAKGEDIALTTQAKMYSWKQQDRTVRLAVTNKQPPHSCGSIDRM